MNDDETRHIDKHKARSKLQLIDQIDQLQADSKTSLNQSEAHLLHELRIYQIELEMQNL